LSLRDRFIAVRSTDALRCVIASKDSELRAKLAQKYDEILSHDYGDAEDLDADEAADLKHDRKVIAKALDRIIMSERPPRVEDGDWAGAFELIADLNGLRLPGRAFPIDTYKHSHTWAPYRERIRPQISPDADRLLAHLEGGRPLAGSSLRWDWTMYAWLNGEEIARLHDALGKVEFGDDNGSGLAEFHKALLASLKRLRKKGADLLLVAD
jgi:hypothetical protein